MNPVLSISSSGKVVFTFELNGDLPTTTSSTNMMQENFTFLPYSVEICHKMLFSVDFGYNL